MASDSIRKIATGQWDDYTAGCFLEYNYFKNYYKMIAIELSKQQAIDADLKTIQQIDFTENWAEGGKYFLLLKKQKKPFQIFPRNCKSIVNVIVPYSSRSKGLWLTVCSTIYFD